MQDIAAMQEDALGLIRHAKRDIPKVLDKQDKVTHLMNRVDTYSRKSQDIVMRMRDLTARVRALKAAQQPH